MRHIEFQNKRIYVVSCPCMNPTDTLHEMRQLLRCEGHADDVPVPESQPDTNIKEERKKKIQMMMQKKLSEANRRAETEEALYQADLAIRMKESAVVWKQAAMKAAETKAAAAKKKKQEEAAAAEAEARRKERLAERQTAERERERSEKFKKDHAANLRHNYSDGPGSGGPDARASAGPGYT